MKKNNLNKDNGGFKVPKGYFESFEDKLSKKLTHSTKEDSMLSTPKNSGFKVPEGYFSSFEDDVLQKIEDQKPKGKVVSLFTKRNLLYISGIAAMIAVILSISINKTSSVNFDDIEIADIHAYFNDGNIELSDEEIASLIGEDVSYAETFEEELLNDQDLIDYLSEENLADEIIFTE
ncbi:hypothetical protein [Aquimarina sp. 2304DJ70-9]|uniref:hypothetical protein n=1 Tax=Aquimarina penaris TaxID=3231044 RepID=UPI003461CDFF